VVAVQVVDILVALAQAVLEQQQDFLFQLQHL
jgi:hypothetical protein